MGGVMGYRNTEGYRKLLETRKKIGSTLSLRKEPALLVNVNSRH